MKCTRNKPVDIFPQRSVAFFRLIIRRITINFLRLCLSIYICIGNSRFKIPVDDEDNLLNTDIPRNTERKKQINK